MAVVAGTLLVLVAAGDIFHSLFHPSGRTTMSGFVMRGVWAAMRRPSARAPRLLRLAGPLGVLATILAWAVTLIVGWALVYWPWVPGGFLLADGLEPAAHDGFDDALYVSMVSLSTLGLGDISPVDPGLRLLMPIQSLMGFGLLTASLTWMLSLYPVLRRIRVLAEEVQALHAASEGAPRDALAAVGPAEAARIVGSLTGDVIAARTDMVQNELVYYFQSGDRLHSLADALPVLLGLAEDASEPDRPPELRLAGRRLRVALRALAETIATDFLRRPGLDLAETFRAYAEDHHPERARAASSGGDQTSSRGDAPWTSRPPSS